MKCFKVLSLVALLAPGISFANDAAHPTTATHEAAAHETAPAAATTAPTADHGTVEAKPAVTAEEKTDTKAFCAKTKEEATTKCNKWLGSQKTSHKEKLVDSKCSEATAATKTDKCAKGAHVSHGEVKFHK